MKSLSLILPYFVEQRLQIFCGIFCLIAVDFLQLFIPRILKRAVDDLTLFAAGASVLMRYALYLAAIALLMSVFRYGWRRCLIGFSRRVEEGLRNQLFSHVQHLSAEYFQEVKTGDLMAHATNDIQNVRMAMGMGLVALTDAVVLGTAAVGFMAFINVRLTLFALIPAPFIIFGTRIFSRKMHRRYLGVQQEFSNMTEAVRERFAGIRIIKAYNRKADEIRRISEISRSYVKSNMNLVRLTGSFFPLMMFFSNLSLALVFFLGGRQTISLEISPGDFVAFISYIGLLTWPMMAIGWVTNLIQRGRASMDRLQIISQTRPKIADAPDALSFQKADGRIRFDGVCFSYPPSGPKALRDVDFLLKPGEVLGIVGPPGSGKTSLVGLIPRIFDVSSGKILLDGIDIRGIKLEDLRAQISFMPQEPFLFARTIAENILFGKSGATSDEMMRASRAAGLYETVMAFEKGFDTLVGEKGAVLSGGQKQRIALARALINPAPVLILDDPISQVDTQTAAGIIETFRKMAGKRTMIIVSHRLSAVRFADQIIVLDQGRITESGNHESLMELRGYYAKTFQLQQIEEAVHAR